MSKEKILRIAHISDLHFAKPTYNPLQFFSKRWLGNLNLLVSRKKQFLTDRLPHLATLFKEKGVEHVVISGDLTTTSHEAEFKEALKFIDELKNQGMQVYTLPGNHDHYTKGAYKKRLFYRFFSPSFSSTSEPLSSYNLKEHSLAVKFLGNKWWFIALDTALATSLISSRGYFSEELEKHLDEALAHIPTDHQVIVSNHFSFFQHESQRKTLVRGSALRNQMHRHQNVKFFLHGHTHRHCIADLRASGLPIVLDSGSTPHRKGGTWNLLEISSKGCDVQVYRWDADYNWQCSQQTQFSW